MLKKNKFKIILSSGIILLPVLFGILTWNQLPDRIAAHWGAAGSTDGFGGKAFVVFGLPLALWLTHGICLWATLRDKGQEKQNKKALGMIFWIIPVLSLFVSSILYCAAFGKQFNPAFFVSVLFGSMLIFMGNYLPKVTPNRTLGIKLPWTLRNEENWRKTHRFGGKVWVIGGILLLFAGFLPPAAMVGMMVWIVLVIIMLPLVYSWRIYRQHQKTGVVYPPTTKSRTERVIAGIGTGIAILIMLGITVVMVSGDIDVTCGDTSMQIQADYFTDLELAYSDIETLAYCDSLDVGERIYGFGSARLLLGKFQNEDFGDYTLYAYTGADGYLVLTSGGETLVIGMKDAAETQALYEMILEKSKE